MRNKSCGNGSKNCVASRNAMRNGIAIGNPNYNHDYKLPVPLTGCARMKPARYVEK